MVSPDILLECFAKVTEYFYLQSANTFNNFEQQKQTAIATVDLAKVIPKQFKQEASQYAVRYVSQAISNYLKTSGMILTFKYFIF